MDGQMKTEPPISDPVNNPPHYGTGNIECIEYLRDNLPPVMYMGYLEGCQ